jgi:hypothetical protein
MFMEETKMCINVDSYVWGQKTYCPSDVPTQWMLQTYFGAKKIDHVVYLQETLFPVEERLRGETEIHASGLFVPSSKRIVTIAGEKPVLVIANKLTGKTVIMSVPEEIQRCSESGGCLTSTIRRVIGETSHDNIHGYIAGMNINDTHCPIVNSIVKQIERLRLPRPRDVRARRRVAENPKCWIMIGPAD